MLKRSLYKPVLIIGEQEIKIKSDVELTGLTTHEIIEKQNNISKHFSIDRLRFLTISYNSIRQN
jgi:hypothetical protein